MPKILIFNNIWIFVIYATDMYENRMHVHVGKKDMKDLAKIWLEPNIELSKQGELTNKQAKEVLSITKAYKIQLISQWQDFVSGRGIQVIKAK